MNLLDEHEDGCKPLTSPCRACRVGIYLRAELGMVKMQRLSDILNEGNEEPKSDVESKDINVLIDSASLGFSVRTRNGLKGENILTLGQLLEKSESDLLCLPNFGRKSLNEVKEVLQQLNLTLRSK